MNIDPKDTDIASREWSDSWQTWIFLHHFLPTRLLRELAKSLVPIVTDSEFEFSDLFDETFCGESEYLAVWQLHPRPAVSALAIYVQGQVRALAWMNDSRLSPSGRATSQSSMVRLIQMEAALELSSVDLQTAPSEISRIAPHVGDAYFQKVLDAFESIVKLGTNSKIKEVEQSLILAFSNFPSALRVTSIKHFGDLFADSDRWQEASALYDLAQSQLETLDHKGWRSYLGEFSQILIQSRATAKYALDGANASADLLGTFLTESPLSQNGLLVANGTYDEMIAQFSSSPPVIKQDRRSACLLPPLLITSHHIDNALQNSANGEFRNSHREFWAVLRRQFALGSTAQRKTTQVQYAASLLDMILRTEDYTSLDLFRLAAGLLVKGADAKAPQRIQWKERIVSVHVDHGLVEGLIELQRGHQGVFRERGQTLVSLFEAWLFVLDTVKLDVAGKMISHIISLATASNASLLTHEDLLTPSLKTLTELANRRPEFSKIRSHEIADLVQLKVNDFHAHVWPGIFEILRLAYAYVDVFEREQLNKILRCVVDFLGKIETKNKFDRIVDAALQVLYSARSMKACEDDEELGAAIIDAILSNAQNREYDNAQFIARLDRFPASVLRRYDLGGKLGQVLTAVREGATPDRTSAVANIQALLLVPSLAGAEGVRVALHSLNSVLNNILSARASSMVLDLFLSIRVFAQRFREIREVAGLAIDEVDVIAQETLDLLMRLWSHAVLRPLIFTTFSIPPKTIADTAIVHNWALATLEFASAVGKPSVAREGLRLARNEPSFVSGIDLAIGTLYSSEPQSKLELDMEQLAQTTRESFYSSLGRHLRILNGLAEESEIVVFGNVLFELTLKFGPRESDVGILIWASRMVSELKFNVLEFRQYEKRVMIDPDFRLLLEPFLHTLSISIHDTQL